MTSVASLKLIRLTHLYIGVFFAPTILFFGTTGGLQMFGLHEASRGSAYIPPAILVHLAQLHKKGTLYLPPRKAAPSAPAKTDSQKPQAPKSAAPEPASPTPNPLPIKIFFAATALALVMSTCTGLFMSWKYARKKMVVVGVLVAGIACPLLLLL
jgi:predicted small lipoprotein YifL